jgi:hypothetical protein
LSRYETAFQWLHKLRAGMIRPDQDRIGTQFLASWIRKQHRKKLEA